MERLTKLSPSHSNQSSQKLTQHSEAVPSHVNQNEVSVYNDPISDENHIRHEFKRLILAFPAMSSDFLFLLTDRIKNKRFTRLQLTAAIENLIDNYTYPQPKIADIISFDKKVKLYTYNEVCRLVDQGDRFESYKRLKDGRYARTHDIELFNLKHLL